MVNTYQEMVDPHDRKYSSLVKYAEGVCRAVGIKYGMAHVELKAHLDEKRNRWVEPVMIEVGARLAGKPRLFLRAHYHPMTEIILTVQNPVI